MVRMLRPTSKSFKALDQLYALKLRCNQSRCNLLEQLHPKIVNAFDAIGEITGTIDRRYIAKCVDLVGLLGRIKPRSIVEMGSGRTSIIFGAWASVHQIPYTAFEQSENWCAVVNQRLADMGIRPAVEFVDVEIVQDKGGQFVRSIPLEADMIYVDAPAVTKVSEYQTFTKKPAYFDVPRYLTSGGRPRAIVVDGRTDTVDLILSLARDYDFRGEYAWAKQRNKLFAGLQLNRHSVFLRKH